jgi:hypothetical protein
VPQFKPTSGVSLGEVASLGEAISLSTDFFSKAQLQRDLWDASQRKRRRIKPLAAQNSFEMLGWVSLQKFPTGIRMSKTRGLDHPRRIYLDVAQEDDLEAG